MRLRFAPLLILTVALTASCGDDGGDDTCTVGTTDGCDNGQICEPVMGEEDPACFAAIQIEGRVFDLADDTGIEGARVVALDANGAARSSVTTSGADGAYELDIRAPRDAEGNPLEESVTLRVAADGYQTFAKAPRTALPVELESAAFDDDQDEWVVQNATTDVGLIALEGDTSTFGIIRGSVDLSGVDLDGGVVSGSLLVVAEVGGEAVSTAITDDDGNFTLFNVPEGDVTLSAFASGISVEEQTVTVTAGEETTDVVLVATTEGLSTVSGTIEYADADCGNETSVILVLESTLEELLADSPAFVRGEAPPGIRQGGVGTSFSIPNVPPGRYGVLAAFENDCLVRDPDLGQGATNVAIVEVTGDGMEVDAEGFKVTGALEVFGPGADGLEVIDDPTPTLSWATDPSTDHYELRVFDSFGNEILTDTEVPHPSGSESVDYVYDGPALEEGMIYQFRAVSVALNTGEYRSATEDLLGVFQFDPGGSTDGGVPTDGGTP